jgi:uncharacterized membrane protein
MGVSAYDTVHATYHPGTGSTAPSNRLASLDIARGIVMVLMAIDHVRVYAGVPAGGPQPGVFFTRWVTHFSAPAFAFLAGTGAFLYGLKIANTSALSRYLATRGAMLVLLELTLLRLCWTFNTDWAHYNLAGVIWMLGWCMLLMAAISRLPLKVIGYTGLAIIVAQPVFDPISNFLPGPLGAFLYQHGEPTVFGLPFTVLYVLVPWIGVMMAGYAFGAIMVLDDERRRALCLRIGLGATAAFVVAATIQAIMQAPEANGPPFLLRVLNQRKYPASPLFLMMTLGPMIAFLPTAERMTGWFARMMTTFGRVPLFYYLLHIPLIHSLAIVVSLIREGAVNPWLFSNFPSAPAPVPPGYRWSLALLYLVFAVAIALLYVPCRWYAATRARDRTGLLRYL